MKRWFAVILACAMLLPACALALAEDNGGAASDSARAEVFLDGFIEFVQDVLDTTVELKETESGDGYIFETTTEKFQFDGSAGGKIEAKFYGMLRSPRLRGMRMKAPSTR